MSAYLGTPKLDQTINCNLTRKYQGSSSGKAYVAGLFGQVVQYLNSFPPHWSCRLFRRNFANFELQSFDDSFHQNYSPLDHVTECRLRCFTRHRERSVAIHAVKSVTARRRADAANGLPRRVAPRNDSSGAM
jgi:hypothetical protein